MGFVHFFIDRPIFAAVISIFIVILGAIAYVSLPAAQYPDVVPPTIVVRASYPGASPEVIAETVATPIEQEVNGVENMLYMSSQTTTDGQMTLTITFKLGTDLDTAQVLVQNRVAIAEPRLPEDVRRLGVTTLKSSPDLLMVIHIVSPDKRYDQLYIGNYALIQLRDALARVDGVGDVTPFGLREYSMRAWLDPERLAHLSLTPGDVVRSLREQNLQVASGVIGQPPVPSGADYQLSVNTLGRLLEPEQFGNIVLKTGDDGRVIKVRDVAQIELGARDYAVNSYLNNEPAVALVIAQRPGSNALATAEGVERTIEELSKSFPDGLEYRIVYNPTVFVRESINSVIHTLFEAVILVVIVVLVFLQNWRASLIPLIAIPVSLVGTFAAMAAFGFSLNMLSLFGLVLGDWHCGRRRDRGRRKRRAAHRRRNVAASGGAQSDGRSHRRRDRDCRGTVGGIRADGVHRRHFRPVLSAICADDRGGHAHLGLELLDAQPGAVRHLAAAARRSQGLVRPGVGFSLRLVLSAVQPRVRLDELRVQSHGRLAASSRCVGRCGLCVADRIHGL